MKRRTAGTPGCRFCPRVPVPDRVLSFGPRSRSPRRSRTWFRAPHQPEVPLQVRFSVRTGLTSLRIRTLLGMRLVPQHIPSRRGGRALPPAILSENINLVFNYGILVNTIFGRLGIGRKHKVQLRYRNSYISQMSDESTRLTNINFW